MCTEPCRNIALQGGVQRNLQKYCSARRCAQNHAETLLCKEVCTETCRNTALPRRCAQKPAEILLCLGGALRKLRRWPHNPAEILLCQEVNTETCRNTDLTESVHRNLQKYRVAKKCAQKPVEILLCYKVCTEILLCQEVCTETCKNTTLPVGVHRNLHIYVPLYKFSTNDPLPPKISSWT